MKVRLDELEHRHRRMQAVTLACASVLAAIVLGAGKAADPATQAVRASSFVLVDPTSGDELATLDSTLGIPMMKLHTGAVTTTLVPGTLALVGESSAADYSANATRIRSKGDGRIAVYDIGGLSLVDVNSGITKSFVRDPEISSSFVTP